MQRLDDGTYGIDEVTGEPIDPERLEALPTARTNVAPSRDVHVRVVIVRLLLFAAAREAAGRSRDEFELDAGRRRSSSCSPTRSSATAIRSRRVLATARVWVNGDEPGSAASHASLHDDDEIAVLPPVSGGAGRRVVPES